MRPPEQFLERMKERLGEKFPAFLSSYDEPPLRGLRVNPLKISSEEFARRTPFPLGERVAWEESGFYIGGEKFGSDVYHAAGLYYLQEPSAMAVGSAAGAKGKRRVLDLCAAPGGKATKLAADMAGEGVLIANEVEGSRAKILLQNVERLGVANCAVLSASPEKLQAAFPAYFDLIVADAPCSGEGMLRKEPNAALEWSERNVLMCAARQRGILDCAADMLAAGGRLVYSTCTFAEEEDERQTEEFLRRHPEFERVEERKLYPHEVRGEGHYYAVLERKEGERGQKKPYPIRKNAAAERAFEDFAEEFFTRPPKGEKATLPDGRMYLVPEGTPDLSAVRVLSLGVELGEWDGKIFRPAHALAMAFGKDARRKVVLFRDEAKAYLRGETLSGKENGWCAVCVEEFPLGLGKCVNGAVKNHLPKGLRKI